MHVKRTRCVLFLCRERNSFRPSFVGKNNTHVKGRLPEGIINNTLNVEDIVHDRMRFLDKKNMNEEELLAISLSSPGAVKLVCFPWSRHLRQ